MRLKVIALPATLLGAALCAAAAIAVSPRPQWPAPPAPPRLQYLDEIQSPIAQEPPAKRSWASLLRDLLGVERASERAAREEPLVQPTGIFVRDGILFVADPGRAAILRYDLSLKKGTWLSQPAGLVSPVGVASSSDGRLYVLDSALKKVFILDAAGKPAGELRGDPQTLGRPAGIAVSKDRVYVSDALNHRIMVYGLEGVFIQSFGQRGTAAGELNFPTYLWYDGRQNRLWVADSGNFRYQSFDADGRLAGTLGKPGNRPGYMARPRGIAQDSEGHVYAIDGAFEALQIFDLQGRLLLFAGVSGSEPGQFNLPGGIFIDENDRVFVADTQNRRVQIFQYLKEGSQ